MAFTPCQGKTACRDDGRRCLTCGRTLEEICWLRDLIDQLASLAVEHSYNNVDDYASYVAQKVRQTVTYRRQAPLETPYAD
ncbi:MAG: hypothetical protein R3E46_17745 [Sedimenticolaceae bacterium]